MPVHLSQPGPDSPPPDLAPDPAPLHSPTPDLVKIAGGKPEELENLSLVLAAVGIDHILDDHSGALLVAGTDAARALYQWRQYQEENSNWPPEPDVRPPPAISGSPPTAAMMILLALFFNYTGSWQPGNVWFEYGAVNSQAILHQGQWWRLLTALTLHADLVHLVGNCLIGGFVIHLLCKTLGYGTGWFFLLLGGVSGNLLNSMVRSDPHLSVGLSTSIFSAIGMFSGLQLFRHGAQPAKDIVLALGAGVGLLAFLGSEGARTDLGAHFFGFVCGICWGVFLHLTRLPQRADHIAAQRILFALAMLALIIAWIWPYSHLPAD